MAGELDPHSFHCFNPSENADYAHKLKTLHRYLLRQVIASLVMTLIVFTFVLLIGNILKEILALIVNRQASMGIVAEAVGLLIPFVWVFALPMAMLTATLLVFGRFSADQELVAARAGGISLVSLTTPILILSLVLSGVSAWVNLEIGPACRTAYKSLLVRFGAEISSVPLPEGRLIKEIPDFIFYVGKNDQGKLQDVIVVQLEHETNVLTTIHAPHGTVTMDATNQQIIVKLYDARAIDTRDGRANPISSSEFELPPFKWEPFGKLDHKPRVHEMTFRQLQSELRELEERMSFPLSVTNTMNLTPRERKQLLETQLRDLTSPVRVQLHRQMAFSFACFGFTLIGIPLGIRVHRRETNVGFGLALILVAIYYSFILIGQALATRPEVAPHLIVWLPNFLFQAFGAVLLWRANRGI